MAAFPLLRVDMQVTNQGFGFNPLATSFFEIGKLISGATKFPRSVLSIYIYIQQNYTEIVRGSVWEFGCREVLPFHRSPSTWGLLCIVTVMGSFPLETSLVMSVVEKFKVARLRSRTWRF